MCNSDHGNRIDNFVRGGVEQWPYARWTDSTFRSVIGILSVRFVPVSHFCWMSYWCLRYREINRRNLRFELLTVALMNIQVFWKATPCRPLNSTFFSSQVEYQKLSGWTRHFGMYLHKNQQMPQNHHFIVMLSQMLVHVSAHQRHR
jgi:hypothetical protein